MSRSCAPVLLALDTSTDWASVALFDGRDVLAEETWHAQRRQGDELFPAIERVLLSTRTALSSVDRVAVAVGPGSFTGLRVAIAAGQGIARGNGAALVGISTLDVLAYPHAPSKQRTCPLLRAWRELETRTQVTINEIEPLYVRQPTIRGSFEQPFAAPPSDERALGLPKRG